MSSLDFESRLKQMEAHLAAISSALLSNQATDLEKASASMRQVSLDFGQVLSNNPVMELTSSDKHRLQMIAGGLAAQRGGLLRLTAMVEQSLGSLVPATRKATYAGSSGPFGSNARQSGAFKLLSA